MTLDLARRPGDDPAAATGSTTPAISSCASSTRAGARAFLRALVEPASGLPQITTAARWTVKPASFLNVGITAAGLAALGAAARRLPGRLQARRDGSPTAQLVGDVGDSAPSRWVDGFADGTRAHLILSLWVDRDVDVLERVSAVLRAAFGEALDGARRAGGARAGRQQGPLRLQRQHLPADGRRARRRPSARCPTASRSRRPASSCSAIPTRTAAPSTASRRRRCRRTRASPRFACSSRTSPASRPASRRAADEAADRSRSCWPRRSAGAGATAVPLVLSPHSGTPDPPLAPERINDYDYVSDDPALDDTLRLPLPDRLAHAPLQPARRGGHRRAAACTRIIRRAMPYGPPYDPAHPDDDAARARSAGSSTPTSPTGSSSS